MNLQKVDFLISAAAPKDFPKERLPEIAFAGKSNVGKSSVINRLLQRKPKSARHGKPKPMLSVPKEKHRSLCLRPTVLWGSLPWRIR